MSPSERSINQLEESPRDDLHHLLKQINEKLLKSESKSQPGNERQSEEEKKNWRERGRLSNPFVPNVNREKMCFYIICHFSLTVC